MSVVGVTHTRHPASNQPAVLIGAHHAVLPRELRGRNLVLRTGLRFLLPLRLAQPTALFYCMFDTFSFKSYLAMTRGFRRGWPRREEPMPGPEAAMVDAVQRHANSHIWDAKRGVLAWPTRRLRAGVADIGRDELRGPDIAFFAQANPDFALGSTLVCLCPLSFENLSAAAVSQFRRRLSRRRTVS